MLTSCLPSYLLARCSPELLAGTICLHASTLEMGLRQASSTDDSKRDLSKVSKPFSADKIVSSSPHTKLTHLISCLPAACRRSPELLAGAICAYRQTLEMGLRQANGTTDWQQKRPRPVE